MSSISDAASSVLAQVKRVITLEAGLALVAGAVSTVVAQGVLNTRCPEGCYRPPISTKGIAGFFVQHIPEMMFLFPSGFHQIDTAAAARERGKTCVHLCVTCMRTEYMPTEPRDVEYILFGNAGNYVKPSVYENLKMFIGDNGLVTERDESVHTVSRRFINPAFRPAALRAISSHVFGRHVQVMLEGMKKKCDETSDGVLVLETFFNDVALNIVADASFRCQDTSKSVALRKAFTDQQELLTLKPYVFVPIFRYLTFLPEIKLLKRILDALRRDSQDIIDSARKLGWGGAPSSATSTAQTVAAAGAKSATAADVDDDDVELPPGTTIMDILLSNGSLPDSDIIDHSLTFLFAGQDTTSGALTFTTLLLAKYPAVQQALFEEIASAVAPGRAPALSDVNDLRYLNNVMKESLRYYPPVNAVGKQSVKDDVLPSGVFIPGGSNVSVSLIIMHFHPGIYGPDVDQFRPERWDDPTLEARVDQVGWMPFSGGKRNCIGKDFAMQEYKMVLSAIVRNFEISIPPKFKEPFRIQTITNRPKEPFALQLRPRTS